MTLKQIFGGTTALALVMAPLSGWAAGSAPPALAPNGNGNGVMVNNRSLQTRAKDTFNLADYIAASMPLGAIGNGTIDVTTPMRNWVADLNAAQGKAIAPCGTYLFSQTMHFGSGVNLSGLGSCVVFTYQWSPNTDAFLVSNVTTAQPTNSAGNDRFADFQLKCAGACTSGAGIHFQNASDFIVDKVRVQEFYQNVRVEGGNAGNLFDFEARGGDGWTSIQPGSASIDVEPYYYSDPATQAPTFSCPNSLNIANHDIGGGDSNYFVEAGVRIVCADGVYIKTGHIGAVQHDVEIQRVAGLHMNAQSIEIGGYLDGNAHAAVYLAPPINGTAKNGTGTGPYDPSGGGTVHVVIHPFTINNGLNFGVDSEDPSADFTLGNVDLSHNAGWGVYAPYALKAAVIGTKFDLVGTPANYTGGVMIGTIADGKGFGTGLPGDVTAAVVDVDRFYGTQACIYLGAIAESQNGMNLTHDCQQGTPPDFFERGLVTTSLSVTGPSSFTGPLTLPGSSSIDIGGNQVIGGSSTVNGSQTVKSSVFVPNGGLTAAGTVAGGLFTASGVPGKNCSGIDPATAVMTGGVVTSCGVGH